jgi:hypothetical protein
MDLVRTYKFYINNYNKPYKVNISSINLHKYGEELAQEVGN